MSTFIIWTDNLDFERGKQNTQALPPLSVLVHFREVIKEELFSRGHKIGHHATEDTTLRSDLLHGAIPLQKIQESGFGFLVAHCFDVSDDITIQKNVLLLILLNIFMRITEDDGFFVHVVEPAFEVVTELSLGWGNGAEEVELLTIGGELRKGSRIHQIKKKINVAVLRIEEYINHWCYRLPRKSDSREDSESVQL